MTHSFPTRRSSDLLSTRSGWNSMRLLLGEKPSQGKDIGKVLGATQRDNGCLKGPGVIVTWCIGHLVEAAPPEAYDAQLKHWSIEQLPIIPERWREIGRASCRERGCQYV